MLVLVSPHDIDVIYWYGESCVFQDVQLCSMYFVMTTYEITPHAPKVFTVYFF